MIHVGSNLFLEYGGNVQNVAIMTSVLFATTVINTILDTASIALLQLDAKGIILRCQIRYLLRPSK